MRKDGCIRTLRLSHKIEPSGETNVNGNWFEFMAEVIRLLGKQGRIGTYRAYLATFRSFSGFCGDDGLCFSDFSSEVIVSYERHLIERGICRNTSSMYMRCLRAVHNRAVNLGFTTPPMPFNHVYTGVDKTAKRAVSLDIVKKIKNLETERHFSLGFARDLFMFSFYTRGMSFVDMAYLRKEDLSGGVLTYYRRKTGKRLSITWVGCMQEIVRKYDTLTSPFLLPIIKREDGTERTQYETTLHLVNDRLKEIAKLIGFSGRLSTYVARHSWASAARFKDIPLPVISEALGHDSETTTLIYLSSIDNAAVDNANKLLIGDL